MRLTISHTTTYSYDQPVSYALLQLRLTPRSGPGQETRRWSTQVQGATRQVQFVDHFRNDVDLVMMDEGATRLSITSEGEVETQDLSGVLGAGRTLAPLWLFTADTALTAPGDTLRALAAPLEKHAQDDPLDGMHRLCDAVAEAVAYTKGTTGSATTAEAAARSGQGVCQDQAHAMIACARLLGRPARYVSGYLMMSDTVDQEASHAWAEIWIDGLGWVGFDAANAQCPDDRYVRVAVGRDYADAAPVHGLRQGDAQEELCVSVQVQQ
ncbi:transglutaminase family protein [Pseudooceanicola aestuarii]|uniref:transglutaminase family protein n=1 Tax=Pseudooceanicola aestuarii TaxID=2697319 RepID=UPI0013D46EBC|nr:transglutaminase family protein [Pseudooceanicola aestuarii]